jgi:hypothetical protein
MLGCLASLAMVPALSTEPAPAPAGAKRDAPAGSLERPAPRAGAAGESDLGALAGVALRGAPAESGPAVARLRAAGAAGMEAALAAFAASTGDQSGDPARRDALDRLCGVRDCAEIRLFWHTDLEAATAAARESGKPLLSLRLLGRLDEELSCANSRFFRTVLYANREIGDLLRERFILHWRSVRPVPKVTIDFGDGTTLERTLTGNSIHYLLDRRGRLLDVLPGLIGPQAFKRALLEGAELARDADRVEDAAFRPWIAARRGRDQRTISAIGRRPGTGPAQPLETMSKAMVEVPIVEALGSGATDDGLRRLAALRRPRVRLDAASRAFLLAKHGATAAPEAEAERLIDTFEASIALDEAINEVRFRPAILARLDQRWPIDEVDLEALNHWVYREVFRAPIDDPLMGLAPPEVYTALPSPDRPTRPSITELILPGG